MKQDNSFWTLVYHPFYGLELHLLFSNHFGNCLLPMQALKIISKGFETDSPQIFSIQILIIWPWALLGSRSQIILAIILLLNDIDEITFSAPFKNVERGLLELFIKEHCSVIKELNISVFSLKLITCLLWYIKGEIQRIFLLFKNIFKVSQ